MLEHLFSKQRTYPCNGLFIPDFGLGNEVGKVVLVEAMPKKRERHARHSFKRNNLPSHTFRYFRYVLDERPGPRITRTGKHGVNAKGPELAQV